MRLGMRVIEKKVRQVWGKFPGVLRQGFWAVEGARGGFLKDLPLGKSFHHDVEKVVYFVFIVFVIAAGIGFYISHIVIQPKKETKYDKQSKNKEGW